MSAFSPSALSQSHDHTTVLFPITAGSSVVSPVAKTLIDVKSITAVKRIPNTFFILRPPNFLSKIFLDYSTTGDGQLTAVQLLNILKETGGKLSDFNLLISKYPQIIINVEVSNEGKRSFANNEIVKDCIDKANEKLSIKDTDGMPIGRILVRPSGTEPLIRVMLEGNDEKFIKTIGNEVAECIRENIN